VGDIKSPSVSPEGQSFAFVAEDGGDSDIFVQRTGGTNPINLTADSTVDDVAPAFSSDGSQIAFRSDRDGGGIFVMGASGESVRRATDDGFSPAWSPDGREIVYSTRGVNPIWPHARTGHGELVAVTLATGARRRLAQGPEIDAVQPSWSPHGTRVAYWGVRAGGQRDLWTIATAGTAAAPVEVTNDAATDWNPVWSPDGRYLYFASDAGGTMGLWRIPIDETSGRVRGEREPLAVSSSYACGFSFTRNGTRLLFASVSESDWIERVGFDPVRVLPTGETTTVFESALWLYGGIGASPDGRTVAFSSTGSQEDLYTVQRDGSGLRQLTNDAFKDRGPAFFPAGDRILFYSTRSGQYEAWSLRPDGSHLTQLTRSRGGATNPSVSPDGTTLAMRSRGGDASVLVARLGAKEEPVEPEPLRPADGEAIFDYGS
jgi:Tol biopolymer transport system component